MTEIVWSDKYEKALDIVRRLAKIHTDEEIDELINTSTEWDFDPYTSEHIDALILESRELEE